LALRWRWVPGNLVFVSLEPLVKWTRDCYAFRGRRRLIRHSYRKCDCLLDRSLAFVVDEFNKIEVSCIRHLRISCFEVSPERVVVCTVVQEAWTWLWPAFNSQLWEVCRRLARNQIETPLLICSGHYGSVWNIDRLEGCFCLVADLACPDIFRFFVFVGPRLEDWSTFESSLCPVHGEHLLVNWKQRPCAVHRNLFGCFVVPWVARGTKIPLINRQISIVVEESCLTVFLVKFAASWSFFGYCWIWEVGNTAERREETVEAALFQVVFFLEDGTCFNLTDPFVFLL
jgi:hypothetical protein